MVIDLIGLCAYGGETKQIILIGMHNYQSRDSSIEDFDIRGVMTGKVSKLFGFDNFEVKWLLDQVFTFNNDYNYKDLLFNKLKEWYNGVIMTILYSHHIL